MLAENVFFNKADIFDFAVKALYFNIKDMKPVIKFRWLYYALYYQGREPTSWSLRYVSKDQMVK